MASESKFKKPLLYGLIGSVLLGATFGIIFVLRDIWVWFEIQVVLTTVVIAGGSLCGLACDLSRTPRGRNLLPKSGLTLSATASLLLLTGIWGEFDFDPFWKLTISVSIMGVATVHVCLLSIAKLAKRFQWIRFIGSQVIFGFAVLLCFVVTCEIDSSAMWRMIAATSIVIAAFSLTIPILHRISKMDRNGKHLFSPVEERNLASVDNEISRLQKRMEELQQIRETLAKATQTI